MFLQLGSAKGKSMAKSKARLSVAAPY